MTTYNVTATKGIEVEKFYEVTPAHLKSIKTNFKGFKVVAVKIEAPKFWYYRNVQVLIHEEVSNGYTLVSAVDGSFNMRRATTTELEYR